MSPVGILALVLAASDPVSLRSLFPMEADVLVDKPGLIRLDLPPEVVAACRGDLSDMRLFDARGGEVPYLLEATGPVQVGRTESFRPKVLDVRRSESTPENGPTLRRETYVLEARPGSARSDGWALVLEGTPPQFVAKIRVTAGSTSVDGSVFRLATPVVAEKLRVPLGPIGMESLRVELEHEGGAWLQPGFSLEAAQELEVGGRSAFPLTVRSTRREGGATIVELDRPRGIVPGAIRVASSTAAFDRKVTVHDEGPQRDPSPLGSASVFRVRAGSVEDLDVPLRPAKGDRLRVVVEDGDSPPLAGLAFTASFGRPTLVASLDGPAVLAFGGGRARRPRYDLAGLGAAPGDRVLGKRAEALLALYGTEGTSVARLAPARANPSFDRTPALAFAMHAGAEIDRGAFSRVRTLDVKPSPEGLARLRLTPEDLAVLRADRGDLRVVDEASRQWPYLFVEDAAHVDVPLAVAARKSSNGKTKYVLAVPSGPAALSSVALDADAPFFDRAYTLTAQDDDGSTVTLAQGRLTRSGGERAAVTVSLASARLEKMDLTVEDGDDAPLHLTAATARAPVLDLYLAAPEGRYALLLTAKDVARPRYELERVRDVVLSVEAGEVVAGALEKNPDYSLASRLSSGPGRQQAVMWGVLVAAVVLLAVFTLRLARR